MRATITLLVVVVVVVVASQEPSPGEPPCRVYAANDNKEKITVPDDQKELELWFSFQERESEVNIAAVTTKGVYSDPLRVNIKQRTATQKGRNGYSSRSDEENTSWCRVRLTQGVKGVNNSRLTAAGHCGDNIKEKEYTRDDVRALIVNMKYGKIDFTVCLVPPHPVCPTGTWRPRGNSRPVEPPVSNTSQCPTACPEQQELQQGVTVVLGAVLAACLLDVVVTSAVLCVIRHITD
ncbi:uncharacterized protein [Procambarus clarkii]|uniref:uncharacterized protein n=1 Tax=Procambarus clarkii TaxID=6728 RepID=UPI003743D6E2